MRKVTATLTILFLFAAFLSAAESAKSLFQKGAKAEARQDYEAAFEFYKAAYQQKPEDLRYRVPYERTRTLSAASKIKRAQKLRDQGNLQEALTLFQQALEIDPSNDLAAQEIRRTEQMMQKGGPGGAATSTQPSAREEEDPLRKRLERASSPVALEQFPDSPITALEMTEDSKVAYETIGKLAGINVLFDPDYTSRRLTIKLKGVSLQEATGYCRAGVAHFLASGNAEHNFCCPGYAGEAPRTGAKRSKDFLSRQRFRPYRSSGHCERHPHRA